MRFPYMVGPNPSVVAAHRGFCLQNVPSLNTPRRVIAILWRCKYNRLCIPPLESASSYS